MSTALVHVPLGAWCYIHNRHEPDLPGDFLACFECCHVYRTATDLLAAENHVRARYGEPAVHSVDRIFACPLCVHDF